MRMSQSLASFETRVRASQGNIRNNFDKTVNSIDSLQKKLRHLNAQRTTATSVNDIRRLRGEINKTERELRKLENLPPLSFRERLRKLGGQFGGLIGLAGGVGLAMQAWSGVKSLFTIGVDVEQTNAKFEVLLKSTDKAKAMITELNSFAQATPYTSAGLSKNAELMLSFGIADEKIMSNLKMLGDVAMGDEAKLSGLTLAFSQMTSTGRLMGQDLLQMINQGFNPLQVISENTGISIGELKKRMEGGTISAEMVSEAFRLATSEGGLYYGMSEKMANSAGGKWNAMMGEFSTVLNIVGLKFVEWVKPIFDAGKSFAEKILPFGRWLRDDILPSVETFTSILQILGVVAAGVGAYMLYANAATIFWSISLGGLKLVLGLVTAAQWLLNIAMSLNPIGVVVALIVGLVAAVVVAWQKFGWFRGAVLGVWEVIKALGTTIKNYVINRFQELLKGITGIGEALVSFFKGDWKKAWEVGRQAGKNLLGADSKQQAIKDGAEAFKSFNKGWEAGNKATPKSVKKITTQGGITQTKQEKSSVFDILSEDEKGEKKEKGKEKSDNIIAGGTRQTHININIQNLGTDTNVYVASVKEGIDDLGERVREELLRALNSVNQMQIN